MIRIIDINQDDFVFSAEKVLSDNKQDDDEIITFYYILSKNDFYPNKIIGLIKNKDSVDKLSYNHLMTVSINKFDKKGFLSLNLESFICNPEEIPDKFLHEFMNQIFINLRDIYHEHTHHDGDNDKTADSLITLSFSDSEEKGLLDLLRMYQEKIIEYHREIKSLLKEERPPNYVSAASATIRLAKGEFLYAKNLLLYYSDRIENSKLFLSIFDNAISSMGVFFDDISLKHYSESVKSQDKLNSSINILTMVVVLLTLFLVIIDVISVYW